MDFNKFRIQNLIGYRSKKPQIAGKDWLNQLTLSFISPLIFCLHSSPSCLCSLFSFMPVNTAVCLRLKVSPTSKKIIDDRFAGRTFPQLQSQALSGKWLRLTECFTVRSKCQQRKDLCAAENRPLHFLFNTKQSKRFSRSSKRWLQQR